MCEEWWTEAKNADEKSGIPARGTAAKQRQFICKNSVGVPVDQIRMIGESFSQQWKNEASQNSSADQNI